MAESKTYKIQLLKNTRFVIFMALLIILFLTNLTLYQVFRIQNSEWNLAFVIVSVILITVICYSIFKMQGVRGLQITLGDTEMTYNRSRFENEVIEYRNIKYLGYFKKNPDDESKFSFFDGMYIYDGSTDKYCFIGISFNEYREIFAEIRAKCEKTNANWHNIKRSNRTLLEELRTLVGS